MKKLREVPRIPFGCFWLFFDFSRKKLVKAISTLNIPTSFVWRLSSATARNYRRWFLRHQLKTLKNSWFTKSLYLLQNRILTAYFIWRFWDSFQIFRMILKFRLKVDLKCITRKRKLLESTLSILIFRSRKLDSLMTF